MTLNKRTAATWAGIAAIAAVVMGLVQVITGISTAGVGVLLVLVTILLLGVAGFLTMKDGARAMRRRHEIAKDYVAREDW